MGFTGSRYTWWNWRIEAECIFEILDIILVNQAFLDLFSSTIVYHLIIHGSAHVSLYLVCDSTEEPAINKHFRFLNFWTKHPKFKDLVLQHWKINFVGIPFIEFQAKLKNIKKTLSAWSKAAFDNIFQNIATLKDVTRVKEAHLEVIPSPSNRAELSKTEAELKKLLKIEEKF